MVLCWREWQMTRGIIKYAHLQKDVRCFDRIFIDCRRWWISFCVAMPSNCRWICGDMKLSVASSVTTPLTSSRGVTTRRGQGTILLIYCFNMKWLLSGPPRRSGLCTNYTTLKLEAIVNRTLTSHFKFHDSRYKREIDI